jgi:ketosteroid isomerase-like protein
MSNEKDIEVLKAAWAALAHQDWDGVAASYTDDMIFVLPGQNDVLRGKAAFRSALDRIGDALPSGFEITDLRYFSGEKEGEVVNVVEWKSAKIREGTQSAILWKFNEAHEITEERWFVDTAQWQSAF